MNCTFFRLNRRGLTLVELLIFTAIITIVSGFAMRAIIVGRMTRANARDRLIMLGIVQSELDRLRVNAASIRPGRSERTDPSWPPASKMASIITARPDGLLQVEVEMTSKAIEGKPRVRLATLVNAAAGNAPAATAPATSSSSLTTAPTQPTAATQPRGEAL